MFIFFLLRTRTSKWCFLAAQIPIKHNQIPMIFIVTLQQNDFIRQIMFNFQWKWISNAFIPIHL